MKSMSQLMGLSKRAPAEKKGDAAYLALRRENEALRVELNALKEAMPAGAPALARKTSVTVAPGLEVEATPAEVDVMRREFAAFSAGGETVPAGRVPQLYERFGERMDGAQLQELLAFLDVEPSAELGFAPFMRWWEHDHAGNNSDKKGRRYTQQFQITTGRRAAGGGGEEEEEEGGAAAAAAAAPEPTAFSVRCEGSFPSHEYRVFFEATGADGAKHTVRPTAARGATSRRSGVGDEAERPLFPFSQVSPWHDVPLKNADGTYNFICEIPKWTRAKMEIATKEAFNPIKQDTKNGKLRDYQWGDMLFNYGALPQTWEDPDHVTGDTGAPGDNDPIDAVEIGARQRATGSVTRVKVRSACSGGGLGGRR